MSIQVGGYEHLLTRLNLRRDESVFISPSYSKTCNLSPLFRQIVRTSTSKTNMSTYKVKHLHTGAEFERPRILINEHQQERDWHQDIDPAIELFHKQLPSYGETALHSLPAVASALGFSHVFVKDESTRFGLPSFKILGASWAVHQALCKYLGLPSQTSLAELTGALKGRDDVKLVTCTEGNWGRDCARMGKYLGVGVKVYVPYFMNAYTKGLIAGEGASVVQLENGSYDDCLEAVRQDESERRALMVLDTSWEGFEEIPQVSLRPTSSDRAVLTGA